MFSDFQDPDSYFGSDMPRGRKRKEEDNVPEGMTDKRPPRAFKDLSDIDLNSELATQIAEATSFRDHVLENSKFFQPNHVTDTMKTCNALLSQAVKLQEAVQTLQRMKAFEDAVIEVMKEQPDEIKTLFFATLEGKLK